MSEVRLALRGLVRSPGFTVVAVLAVALGIGANTAVFTIVNSVLLRPLPFPEPERLYALSIVMDGPFGVDDRRMPDGLYLDFRKQDRYFEKLTAFNSQRMNMTGAGDARSVRGAFATADFFSVLGAHAALGRAFAPGEDQPGHDGVVVIGNELWRSAFGADPAIVGKSVRLDGKSHTVVGVMPAGFAFPEALDVWVPRGVVLDPHNSWSWSVVGRLMPGALASQATAELDALLKRLPDGDFGGDKRRPPAKVVSLLESVS
ncbi:MAG TPA: ABC transporter permease, partial [Bryobacteraceae bacterium]|nr:ABC transporter permease [Bryobacteraceae bacterium]